MRQLVEKVLTEQSLTVLMDARTFLKAIKIKYLHFADNVAVKLSFYSAKPQKPTKIKLNKVWAKSFWAQCKPAKTSWVRGRERETQLGGFRYIHTHVIHPQRALMIVDCVSGSVWVRLCLLFGGVAAVIKVKIDSGNIGQCAIRLY